MTNAYLPMIVCNCEHDCVRLCVCVYACRLSQHYGGFDKKWNQQFNFQQRDPEASPRKGAIVQHFHHNAAIWGTEGSATGSLPEQRQTPIHICIEVVI